MLLTSSLRPLQNLQNHYLSRRDFWGEQARVLGHSEAFYMKDDLDREGGISTAKPLLCLPFASSTSTVPRGIRQTPLAWSPYCTRHTLDIFTSFMDNRPHGVATVDMSDFCPMVAQHHHAQLPSQASQQAAIQDPGSQAERKKQYCRSKTPPLSYLLSTWAYWKCLHTPRGDLVPVYDQRPYYTCLTRKWQLRIWNALFSFTAPPLSAAPVLSASS